MARRADLAQLVTPHLLARGSDIRTVQALLRHQSVNTTMVYTHVLNRAGLGVASPLDGLPALQDQ